MDQFSLAILFLQNNGNELRWGDAEVRLDVRHVGQPEDFSNHQHTAVVELAKAPIPVPNALLTDGRTARSGAC